MYLDTELCEQPASFAMTFCVLPSLCKVSMVVFLKQVLFFFLTYIKKV